MLGSSRSRDYKRLAIYVTICYIIQYWITEMDNAIAVQAVFQRRQPQGHQGQKIPVFERHQLHGAA
jgi:hypothetical protein